MNNYLILYKRITEKFVHYETFNIKADSFSDAERGFLSLYQPDKVEIIQISLFN